MKKIENAYSVLLNELTKKNVALSDALDVAAQENNVELAAELSEKGVRIDAALVSLDEIVNALRGA